MENDLNPGVDPEIAAISTTYLALKELPADAQARVLKYVADKLGVSTPSTRNPTHQERIFEEPKEDKPANALGREDEDQEENEIEGISPVARKWIARNGLDLGSLTKIFSLGVDEIDLVSKTVPGKNKKDRMHNVFLLKGVAAYLGTGAARFSHEQVKETCLHYDAFDAGNFATYFKSLASDVSGNKESGYSLTARGLTNATDLIKTMTQTLPQN